MNIPKEKLDKAKEQLKKEFDGIDEIIEQLFRILASWRDSITRPVVVPIFGMTGVGKTSLINRAIELLDLSDRTFKFTCGSSDEHDHSSKFQNDLISRLGFSEYDCCTSITLIKSDSVFILDECQKMRTINMGMETPRAEYNEIWKLLDEGSIDYKVSDSSDVMTMEKWFVVLNEILRPKCKDCIVDNTRLTSPGIIDDLDVLGLIEYLRDTELYKKKYGEEEEDDGLDPKNPPTFYSIGQTSEDPSDFIDLHLKELERIRTRHHKNDKYFADIATFNFEAYDENTISLVPTTIRTTIRNILCELFSMTETMDIMKKLVARQTFDEFCNFVSDLLRSIKAPHRLDFHNSIVFVIGNIDEAFTMRGYMDADADADLLHRLTKHVNVNDIKSALLYRFRKEEVARLGNNYLIYPTFNVATFKKIITRYLDANIAAYRENTGINIAYNDQIVNMIYSEGVFPAQGARSVMSTINNFCSIFSEIDRAASSLQGSSAAIKDVKISLPDTITTFKRDDVDIQITFTDANGATNTQSVNYPLHIGRLRNPEHDEARYIKAVHELGHAFMMMIETGRYPSAIVTTSSSTTGGYCIEDLADYFNNSVPTPETVRSRVRISLGGWVAERLVYPSEYCSLGSGSDIEALWEEITESIYKEGFFNPVSYAQGCNDDGTPKGLSDSNVEQSLKKELDYLTNNTIHILREFTALLKHLSCPLAEKGSYTQQEFIDVLKAIPEDADADVRKQRDELIKKMDGKATKRPAPSKYKEILADKTYRGSIIFDDKKTFWQRVKAKFKRKK